MSLPPEASRRHRELVREIRRHDHLYFVEDAPEITDAAYDLLFRELEAIERRHPELAGPDSPTAQVAGQVAEGFAEVPHLAPMLSLQSLHGEEELREFTDRMEREIGSGITYCLEPKFDGLSVELVYRGGSFVRGATRGNGAVGEDITSNLRTIRSLPLRLAGSGLPERLAVRGEAVLPVRAFRRMNDQLVREGKEPFKNPRNAAAGSLRQLDPGVAASRPLALYAYDVLLWEGGSPRPGRQSGVLRTLARFGFLTAPELSQGESGQRAPGNRNRGWWRTAATPEEVVAYHARLQAIRERLDVELDGAVVKVDRIRDQRELGERSRSPRWAAALKFPPTQAETGLRALEVQVGRTGKLTPVALLEPVVVGGVTVSRASLHNEGMVRSLEVAAGDRVRVQRAGDVIPQIVGVVSRREGESAAPWTMPAACPECGREVRPEGANHFCIGGWDCPAQRLARLTHFVGKGAMEIEALGEELVQLLIESELVQAPADFFRLTRGQLLAVPPQPAGRSFDERTARAFVGRLRQLRTVPLERVLVGLGLPGVGPGLAARIAAAAPAILRRANRAAGELASAIGPTRATRVEAALRSPRTAGLLAELREAGVLEGRPDSGTAPEAGAMRWNRADLIQALARLGGSRALDVPGLTAVRSRELVEAGLVARPRDLFRLRFEELMGMPGRRRRPFAEKSAANLLRELESARRVRLDRFLFALGIPHVGEHVARVLAGRYGSVGQLEKAEREDLLAVHEIGEQVADAVLSFFALEANRRQLSELLRLGVRPVWEKTGAATLAGTRIVLTGTLPTLTRREAGALIERHGGRVVSSVSSRTSLLVAGSRAGSKLRRARALEVPVGDERFLRRLVAGEASLADLAEEATGAGPSEKTGGDRETGASESS